MADKTGVVTKVVGLAQPIAQTHGLELVDVEYLKEGGRWILRLYIDKPEGVALDDCEAMSNAISPILDEEEVILHPYHLEVSSPGLERPLKKRMDYERFRGRMIKLTTFSPLMDRKRFSGIIQKQDEQGVHLEVGNSIVSIPWENIAGARLMFEPGGSAGGSVDNEQ